MCVIEIESTDCVSRLLQQGGWKCVISKHYRLQYSFLIEGYIFRE